MFLSRQCLGECRGTIIAVLAALPTHLQQTEQIPAPRKRSPEEEEDSVLQSLSLGPFEQGNPVVP